MKRAAMTAMKPVPIATGGDKDDGWFVSPEFLDRVSNLAENAMWARDGATIEQVSWEATDEVIRVLVELGYLELEPTAPVPERP